MWIGKHAGPGSAPGPALVGVLRARAGAAGYREMVRVYPDLEGRTLLEGSTTSSMVAV